MDSLATSRRRRLARAGAAMATALALALALAASLDAERSRDGGGRRVLLGASTSTALWTYAIIPFIAAFVGWGTNVVALRMTFYPLEFFPAFLAFAQPKGQPFGLLGGWQGIIPSKAGEMAEILVDLMTKKLIDIKEIFSRLDEKKVASIMDPEMRAVTEGLFEKVLATEAPLFWNGLPTVVRDELITEAVDRSSGLLENIVQDLMENVYEVLDLKSMVVRLALGNKDKVVNMFREVGAKEFLFIERSGIYFGFLFGLAQMVTFYFVDKSAPQHGIWLLPVFGFLVGYLTNYVALKIIFTPVEPKMVCGLKIHGVFMRRQNEVSEEFARLNQLHFCNAENLWDEMMTGAFKDKFEALVRRNAANFFDTAFGAGTPMVKMMLGQQKYESIKRTVIDSVFESIPDCVPVTYDYQNFALDIETTVRERMQKLPGADFERVLHPVFEQDEIKLIVVGGLLGAATGVAQYYLAFSSQ